MGRAGQLIAAAVGGALLVIVVGAAYLLGSREDDTDGAAAATSTTEQRPATSTTSRYSQEELSLLCERWREVASEYFDGTAGGPSDLESLRDELDEMHTLAVGTGTQRYVSSLRDELSRLHPDVEAAAGLMASIESSCVGR